jgi:hypothetical protein
MLKTAMLVAAATTAAAVKPPSPSPFPQVLDIMRNWADSVLQGSDQEAIHSEYPYFNFLPMRQASAIPSGPVLR